MKASGLSRVRRIEEGEGEVRRREEEEGWRREGGREERKREADMGAGEGGEGGEWEQC